MIDELMLKRIIELDNKKICEFISKNLDKFTKKDIEVLEDLIIERKDIYSIHWFMENVKNSKKLKEAFKEVMYTIPLDVETLSDEEVENIKSAMEEYEQCREKSDDKKYSNIR